MNLTYSRLILTLSASAIFFLALVQGKMGLWVMQYDKAKHILAFIVLAYLINKAFTFKNHFIPIGILIFIGFIIEFAQQFVPTRGFGYKDLAADMIGIAIYYTGRYFYSFVSNKEKSQQSKTTNIYFKVSLAATLMIIFYISLTHGQIGIYLRHIKELFLI